MRILLTKHERMATNGMLFWGRESSRWADCNLELGTNPGGSENWKDLDCDENYVYWDISWGKFEQIEAVVLAAKASKNKSPQSSWTLLHWAAHCNKTWPISQFLLDTEHVDVMALDSEGRTALDIALACNPPSTAAAEMLQAHITKHKLVAKKPAAQSSQSAPSPAEKSSAPVSSSQQASKALTDAKAAEQERLKAVAEAQLQTLKTQLVNLSSTDIIGTVLYDYKAVEADQLDLIENDCIKVTRKDESGWWEGASLTTGKSGLFPANYIKVNSAPAVQNEQDAKIAELEKKLASQTQILDEQKIKIDKQTSVLQEANTLKQQLGLANAEITQQKKLRLTAETQLQTERTQAQAIQQTLKTQLTNLSPADIIGTVLYDYKAVEADQLDLIENDYIKITFKDESGWWKGTSLTTGKSGLLPANYIKVNSPSAGQKEQDAKIAALEKKLASQTQALTAQQVEVEKQTHVLKETQVLANTLKDQVRFANEQVLEQEKLRLVAEGQFKEQLSKLQTEKDRDLASQRRAFTEEKTAQADVEAEKRKELTQTLKEAQTLAATQTEKARLANEKATEQEKLRLVAEAKLKTKEATPPLENLGKPIIETSPSLLLQQAAVEKIVTLPEALSAIKSDPTLRAINLSGNKITDADAKKLADCLPHAGSLLTLNLSNCGISPAGALSLANTLLITPHLLSINLLGNAIGLASSIAVQQALLTCIQRQERIYQSLREICVAHSAIGQAGVVLVDKATASSRPLSGQMDVVMSFPEYLESNGDTSSLAKQVLAVNAILKDYYTNNISDSDYTLAHHAAATGDVAFLTAVLATHPDYKNKPDSLGNTPLLIAAQFGQLGALIYLLNQGADISHRNKSNEQALELTIKNKKTDVRDLLLARVKMGLELHLACEEGNLERAQELIQLGADVNMKDKAGDTPLHKIACGGMVKIARLLIQHGGDLNITNARLERPLELLLRIKPVNQAELAECFLQERMAAGGQLDHLLAFCKERYIDTYEMALANKTLLDKTVSQLVAVDIGSLMHENRWKYIGHLCALKGKFFTEKHDLNKTRYKKVEKKSKDHYVEDEYGDYIQSGKDSSGNNIYKLDTLNEFEGFQRHVFLALRIRVLFELIVKLETQAIPSQQLPGEYDENVKKLKKELLLELETLASHRDAFMLNYMMTPTPILIDSAADNLARKVFSLSEGESYSYAAGYSGHAVYLNFVCHQAIADNRIVVRIDNLGESSEIHVPQSQSAPDKELYPYAFTVPRSYFTPQSYFGATRAPVYLQGIVTATFKEKEKALPLLYNAQRDSSWSGPFTPIPDKTVIDDPTKLAQYWPAKLPQTVGNCVVKNHQTGLEIRWMKNGEKSAFYHWFREMEVKAIPVKTYATNHYAQYNYSSSELSSAAVAKSKPTLQTDTSEDKAAVEEFIISQLKDLRAQQASIAKTDPQAFEILEREIAELSATQAEITQVIDPVQEGKQQGYNALHLAVLENDLEKVNALIEAGEDLQAKTANGYTALHLATIYNFTEIADKLLSKEPGLLFALTAQGDSALHLATQQENTETVNNFLEKGADVQVVNKKGQTPRMLAQTAQSEEIQKKVKVPAVTAKQIIPTPTTSSNPDYLRRIRELEEQNRTLKKESETLDDLVMIKNRRIKELEQNILENSPVQKQTKTSGKLSSSAVLSADPSEVSSANMKNVTPADVRNRSASTTVAGGYASPTPGKTPISLALSAQGMFASDVITPTVVNTEFNTYFDAKIRPELMAKLEKDNKQNKRIELLSAFAKDFFEKNPSAPQEDLKDNLLNFYKSFSHEDKGEISSIVFKTNFASILAEGIRNYAIKPSKGIELQYSRA